MDFNNKKFLLKLFASTLVILVIILGLLNLLYHGKKSSEILAGYFVSLIIFILGFLTINWALKKSLKTFLAFILGGMFLRFVLIGVAIFLFMRFTQIDIVYFILSFFLFYLIYQFFEIRFLNMKISKGRK